MAASRPPGAIRRLLVRWVRAVAALGVLLVLAWASLSGVASWKLDRARASWESRFGTWSDFLARHPGRDANETALRLEARAAALGIDLAPKSAAGRARPDAATAERWHEVADDLRAWLDPELARPTTAIEPPPAALAAFLDERRALIDAVRQVLASEGPPLWEERPELLAEAPLPNLLGQLSLHRLLVADALARARAGDRDGAAADLEASWQLDRALEGSAHLITTLIRIAIVRLQVGALRHVEGASPEWPARLAGLELREDALDALRFEGEWVPRSSPHSLLAAMRQEDDGLLPLAFALRPLLVAGAADYTERWGRALDSASSIEHPCAPDPTGEAATFPASFPRWNLVGRSLAPNLLRSLDRVSRIEIDVELTRKVLDLRSARDAGGGTWPAPSPTIAASACPEARWVYAVTPSGGMSIALDRPIEWPQQTGLFLPTRYEAPPPLAAEP